MEALNYTKRRESEERKKRERVEGKRREIVKKEKCSFGVDPDIDIKPSSLEPSCEKLSEPFSGAESDTNSSFTKNLCEELPKDKYVPRVELDINTKPSLREKPCDE